MLKKSRYVNIESNSLEGPCPFVAEAINGIAEEAQG
jgi:hypothetical protein